MLISTTSSKKLICLNQKKGRSEQASRKNKPHNLAREKLEKTLSTERKGKENSSPLHLKNYISQTDYEGEKIQAIQKKNNFTISKNCG